MMNRSRLLIMIITFGLIAGVFWMPDPANAQPATHEVRIDASDFAYTPGRIEVRQGDEIMIILTASDVVHGFALDGHDINTRVVPGVSQQITFTAHQTGKFRFRCSVSCGTLHPFMIGELVVTPNSPFWKAGAVAVISFVSMFLYLWRNEDAPQKAF